MTDSDSDSWQQMWDAREAALKSVLGDSDGSVLHAVVPFYLGGNADVLRFRQHIPGCVFATCDLLGESSQMPSDLGSYELLIAHRDGEEWGANIISRLARYTCDARLQPGETMDIGPATPEGSTIAAFLYREFARFQFQGRKGGLLLCLGITENELEHYRAGECERVIAALESQGIYPYTDLYRASVV